MLKLYLIPAVFGLLHIGYILAAFFFKKKEPKPELHSGTLQSIEHIVCFKNESKFIKQKLANCYEIDYPHIHHTFVNDNSSDNTLELLNKYSRGNSAIISNEVDLGKNQTQIKVVNQTESDLILFTDANVFLNHAAIDRLIDGFDDQTVGVCGNVTITAGFKKQDISGKYWQLEKIIKSFQSFWGSVIGFDGGFYCIKRKNYNLKRENELSDFESAFLIFEQQKRTKYLRDATAIEVEKRDLKNSFKARMRASNRVFWSYVRITKYIHKLKLRVILHFVFHKICRYVFIISYIVCLPFILIDLSRFTPLLLLIFCIPYVFRFTLEGVALCTGGLIALKGKEYTTWSQRKA